MWIVLDHGGAKTMTAAASATTAEVHLLSDDLTEAPIPPAPAVIKAPAPGDSPLRAAAKNYVCLLYTSPSPRDRTRSRMPSSA